MTYWLSQVIAFVLGTGTGLIFGYLLKIGGNGGHSNHS